MKPTIRRKGDLTLRRLEEGSSLKIMLDGIDGAANLAFGWVSFEPGMRTTAHTRDVEEVIYVLKGEAFVVTTSYGEFRLGAGDTLLILPGTEHYHENRGDSVLEQLYIFAPQGPEKPLRELPVLEDKR